MKKMNVGVALQGDPQKGITLIALIITIIVMLILVGVTINVALNGGLFDKAKTAGEQTQRETDKEQLLSAVIGTLNDDGTVNEAELQAHLPDNFKYENGVYKNKVTGKEYTIDTKTGKVTEVINSNSGSSENENNQQEEQQSQTNILAGKKFSVVPYQNLDEELEGGTTIEFTENSVCFTGIDGRYTYNPTTKEVQLTLVIEEQEYIIPGNYLYEIKQNGNTVNWLFLYNNGDPETLYVSTTNEATGLLPFEGKFKNKEDENDIIEFTVGEKYGSFKGNLNSSYYNSEEYCYIEQINTFYFSDNGREECTYTKDSNGNIDTITINNVVYEKVNE